MLNVIMLSFITWNCIAENAILLSGNIMSTNS